MSSGIAVMEIPPRGARIAPDREGVTAFIGPAPRGPVDVPVAVRSLEEFLARFGVPGYLSRMELLLYQYFENGGTLAIVVRVCRTRRHNRISLPGPAGALVLEALNPGPLEHLRASVDYDGIGADERSRFNLVIHRCRSPDHPLVEEQESFRRISIVPGEPDFIGDALAASALLHLCGPVPAERPGRTVGADAGHTVRYVYSRCDDPLAGTADDAPLDYDLVGSHESGTGLFALDPVPWIDFVCMVPGVSGTSLGAVALFAAERYCRSRQALLLIDPPAAWETVGDAVCSQRERGFASPNALTYFPALDNPLHAPVGGGLSAAGAIAGRLCSAGLGVPPEQPLILGRSRPALELDEPAVHQLGRLGVNTLVRQGAGRVGLAGLVTLARSGGVSVGWNDLRRRRIFLFTAASIARHTRWAAFEGPSPALWQEVRRQCSEFLAALRDRGLFQGATAQDSFYVKCDADTSGGGEDLRLVVGIALARPGDYAAFEVHHGRKGCEVREIGWQPGPELALTG